MTLHLPTILLLLTVTLGLQAIVWILVWITQRHLYELRFVAAGYSIFALGILLLAFRDLLPGALFVIVHNYVIHIGVVLLAHGFCLFLGQRSYMPLVWACVAGTLVFWPLAMAIDPENVAIRILASNLIAGVMVLVMMRSMLIDRSQPKVLRWFTTILLSTDLLALTLRSVIAYQNMHQQEVLAHETMQAWYFYFFNIFISGLFLAQILMVGVRLASDLRQKNEALQREVGERGRLQDQLSATLQTEQALRQEQKQLLRMVTHEFRTPLAIVDRAAEMIDVTMPDRPEAVTKRLGSIRDAVQRLVQLIDRFLDSERRDVNVVQPERIDIQSLLNGVRRHFEGIDAASRLFFIAAGDLPFYRGDADMLSTVLINLIDNAMKYATGDSPIEIAARTETGAGADAIVITVTDHGIGIPAAELASIGQRFFRASNTTAATGTGLGLYNARRLLDYHNATLALRPGRDGGTVAAIRLPLPGVAASLEMSDA